MSLNYCIVFVFCFICKLGYCQLPMDSLVFEKVLIELDSILAANNPSAKEAIDKIVIIRDDYIINREQNARLILWKGSTFAHQYKDSLAQISISEFEKEYNCYKAETNLVCSEYYSLKALLALNEGSYNASEQLYFNSLNINKAIHGNVSLPVSETLNSLATLYYYKGQYPAAAKSFSESLDIHIEILGNTHSSVAIKLNNLAVAHEALGNYAKAENLHKNALGIRRSTFGKDHISTSESLGNLAELYKKMGRYEEAEEYLLESIKIAKASLGEDHPTYAGSLNNLGFLYKLMGNYEDAEYYFKRSLEIGVAHYGEDHPDIALYLNNLASIYDDLERYDEVETLLIKSSTIYKRAFGEDNAHYARSLNNLAGLYESIRAFDKAESLYLKSLEIRKIVFGEDHPAFAMSLNNLAYLYKNLGKFDKAEPLYERSIKIRQNALGDNHPDVTRGYLTLGGFYLGVSKYNKVVPFALKYSLNTRLHLRQALNYMSNNEFQNYKNRELQGFDLIKELATHVDDDSLNHSLFNSILFEKGLLLKNVNQIREFLLSSSDTVLVAKYKDHIEKNKSLSKLYELPKSEREGFKELLEEIELLEKDLALASKKFRIESELNNIGINDMYEKITDSDIVIEFTHYHIHESNDSIVYAACVFDPRTSDISFHPLFTSSELQLLADENIRKSSYVNILYAYEERGLKVVQDTKTMYDLVWKPLENLVEGKENIYYSSSGILNRLNLNAIPINKKETIGDRFNIINLSSTRNVCIVDETKRENTAYIIGDVDYSNSNNSKYSMDTIENHFASVDRSLLGNKWAALDWTGEESNDISMTLKDNQFSVETRTGEQATEEDFKNLSSMTKSPRVIHLATHGYFFPDPVDSLISKQEPIFKMSKLPLLRSGLILAGANKVWSGEDVPEGHEDGVLTAYEISNMNLTDTELVVLSACETGLGDIKGHEGVYGLQRAFKMAGAKNLIMSLWQVPDRETSVFMTTFYENWLNHKMSIREAFNKTQLAMRDRFYNPYQWAGFVLIE